MQRILFVVVVVIENRRTATIGWTSYAALTSVERRFPIQSWSKALDLLKQNYANAMVIRSIPEILHHKVVIVTVHGVRQALVSHFMHIL